MQEFDQARRRLPSGVINELHWWSGLWRLCQPSPGEKDCSRSGAAPYVDDPAVFESAEIETLKERVDFEEIIDVFKMHSIGSIPIGVGHRECFPPEAGLGSAGSSFRPLSNLFRNLVEIPSHTVSSGMLLRCDRQWHLHAHADALPKDTPELRAVLL